MTYDEIRRRIEAGAPAPKKIAPPPSSEEIRRELRDADDHTLAHYAEVEPRMDRGWGALTDKERYSLAARAVLARRQNAAERQRVAAAEQAREQAKIDKAVAARRADIAAELRLSCGGALAGAALEAAVDQVITRETLATRERQHAEKRRQIAL